MYLKQLLLTLITLACTFIGTSLYAEESAESSLRLASIFNTGMVLQQKAAVPVWGWAEANSDVSVQFGDQSLSTTSDENGDWKVTLKAMDADAAGKTLTVKSGGSTVTFDDVLIGEVWIAAGQSNMNAGGPNKDTGYYPFYTSPADADKIAPVRMVRYGWGASLTPLSDNKPATVNYASWKNVSIADLKNVNTPTQFARILRDKLKVPVGILHVSVSGTNQAAWMHRKTLEGFPSQKKENFYQEYLEVMTQKLAKDKKLNDWAGFEAAMAKYLANPKGRSPASSTVVNHPTALYNTRIHPLAPFAIKGAIWHQGEGGPGGPYGERLAKMIQQWREHFGQDFYFIWGTLSDSSPDSPPLTPSIDYFYRSGTNRSIHTALKHFGDDKKVEMVDFFDLGDTDTHWLNKNESGRRMALAALDLCYDQEYTYSGPRMTEINIKGSTAVVTFTLVGKGISYQASLDGISGIVVKSKDGAFAWADVKVVDGKTLEISHPKGENIDSLGYAINRNPHETIFNSEGLPATPFEYNIGRIPYQPTGPKLITLAGEKKGRGKLSIAHVREQGYRFQIVPVRGTNKKQALTVSAFIPKAWNDEVEVIVGGKSVEFTKDLGEAGTLVTFDLLQDGTWVTVCQKGQADKFEGIKRY